MAGKRRALAAITLLIGLLLVSGCTFWVETWDGRRVRATLPDSAVQRFLDRMDLLSMRLLRESERLGNFGLRRVATELREEYFRLMRRMGTGALVSLKGIRLKLEAFELQMTRRLASPLERRRYRPLSETLERLNWELSRFKSQIWLAAR